MGTKPVKEPTKRELEILLASVRRRTGGVSFAGDRKKAVAWLIARRIAELKAEAARELFAEGDQYGGWPIP